MKKVKFNLGMVLIKGVIEYRREFMRDNLDDPEDSLTVVLSPQAHSAIVSQALFDLEHFCKVDIKEFPAVKTLIGLPVRVSRDAGFMDIEDTRPGGRRYYAVEDLH